MPANIRDNFAELQRFGQYNNDNLPATANNSLYGNSVSNTQLDSSWARAYDQSAALNNYYDYFFSGQDICVCVDGTEEDARFKALPIMQFGFNIVQQKTPLYGFWSYTYDAVMRGARVIQGQFTIATRTPQFMKQLLSKAAQSRQENRGSINYNYNRGLTEDDANIEAYWGKNRFDNSLASAGTNLYSVHPPFSFVIVYGIQNVSVNDTSLVDRYNSDNPLMLDTNERLVDADALNQSNRVVLDACEITSMSTGFGSNGEVVAETYAFFARDIVIP